MNARVCDQCQPVLDGAFDALNRAITQRAAAEGHAWAATDLLLRYVEWVLEHPNTPAEEHAEDGAQLLADAQTFLLTSPVYTRPLTVPAGTEGEAAPAGAHHHGESY